MVNLIAGICIICPAWNTNGTLTMARKALRGWTRIKPSRSHLPVPRGVLIAIAVQLVIMGSWPVAAAILLGFDCYLRHSELRNLRVSDVALPGDPRLVVGSYSREGNSHDGAAILLRTTKAGRPQWVSVRDSPSCVRSWPE